MKNLGQDRPFSEDFENRRIRVVRILRASSPSSGRNGMALESGLEAKPWQRPGRDVNRLDGLLLWGFGERHYWRRYSVDRGRGKEEHGAGRHFLGRHCGCEM